MMNIMINDFFKYSYFNITKDDSMQEIMKKCAEKAYLDLCRTIKFKTADKNLKAEYKSKVCDRLIIKAYDVLLNAVESSDDKQNAFDSEHKRICEEIIGTYSEICEFTYGQAQKWLNMTLKYIVLLEENSELKSYLHIPVDSLIMQAVGSDNAKLKHCLKLKCVPKKTVLSAKYSEGSSKPWSKWNYDEYIAFQNTVRKAINEKTSFCSPIEWENEAWIEVAEYRK